MTAHDLYTRTLSDYKSCLCSSPALTFVVIAVNDM